MIEHNQPRTIHGPHREGEVVLLEWTEAEKAAHERHKARQAVRNACLLLGALAVILAALWRAVG